MAESPRELLAGALSTVLAPEQLKHLIDEVLAIEKVVSGDVTCPHCGRKAMQRVKIADAKAVALALPDLLNQAYGRPGESSERTDPVNFKRLTLLEDDDEVNARLTQLHENSIKQERERAAAASSSSSNGGSKG